MSLHATKKPTPPHLHLKSDEDEDPQPLTLTTGLSPPNKDKPLPKSPGSSKFGTFFGWGSPATPATEAPDKTFSPLPSPFKFSKSATFSSDGSFKNPGGLLETPKALHSSTSSREYCESYLATPPDGISTAAQIDEMEEELKAISVELATSIRRELDLEDLVDRLQAERDNPTSSASKRTSDYFSDSGYSSAKFSEYDQSREEVDKIQRRADQEKAQIRLELTDKLQDERSRRHDLDKQIRDLSEKASRIDLAQINNLDAGDRVRDLESTCETLRRKLSEERKVKDNFEDLLSALRGELENTSNERDNLRDKIVPSLRARVEALESQAFDIEKMANETTKMQQELQVLKQENTSLKHSKSMQSITEEGGISSPQLSRSNSITRDARARPASILGIGGLSRSKTVRSTESRDQVFERLKDVEEQRDALHRALKALLDRQEFQSRENSKKVRALEQERDRLLSSSPQKAGYQDEVSKLRSEIAVLRRRSEEAIEQKWQVENGLVGLKMDLDRAQQEIASLRSLLDEQDILIPDAFARASSGSDTSLVPVTSETLTSAYNDLQQAYTEVLERIKALESATSIDEKTKLAMERLETSLASVVAERGIALQDSSVYLAQLSALKDREREYMQSEKALADELSESARRVEELAIQVRQQLATNDKLRDRIAETVASGETEHNANRERLTTMQARMRYLGDKLEACQATSEERLARHENEMQNLKDSQGGQLHRMRDAPQSATFKSPKSSLFGQGSKNPRLSMTTSGEAVSLRDDLQIDNLRARIAELENSLTDADEEMQQVVGRMNEAQIKVLELQEEREAAVRDTRRLEKLLQAEKVKAFEDRFKTLQT
ncbi:golgin subfamily A member 4 [Microdochium nivale]|nr:golgin subfamily A member 4 [Microdochium nivale]